MISPNELKPGVIIIYNDAPCQVLTAKHSHVGRGGSVVQAKLKNLKTGAVVNQSFKQADSFEEAEIERESVEYLYGHKGEFWFAKFGDRSQRFTLKEESLGDDRVFLKSGIELEAIKFGDEVISIILPIKMDLKVVEAPPNIRGNTAQGGTKIVTLETGAKTSVPLFIEAGDTIRVNTESGEYVERSNKG